jgi:hypothetical protein
VTGGACGAGAEATACAGGTWGGAGTVTAECGDVSVPGVCGVSLQEGGAIDIGISNDASCGAAEGTFGIAATCGFPLAAAPLPAAETGGTGARGGAAGAFGAVGPAGAPARAGGEGGNGRGGEGGRGGPPGEPAEPALAAGAVAGACGASFCDFEVRESVMALSWSSPSSLNHRQ